MFYAWCLPCTLLSVNFLDSIQTQLNLWVHMMCINPISTQSCVARPYSTPKERVWDMVIKQLVAQVFNLSCKSSHDVSNSNCQSKTCNFFALASLISTVFQLITSRHFLLSALLTLLIHSLLKLKF